MLAHLASFGNTAQPVGQLGLPSALNSGTQANCSTIPQEVPAAPHEKINGNRFQFEASSGHRRNEETWRPARPIFLLLHVAPDSRGGRVRLQLYGGRQPDSSRYSAASDPICPC